MTLTNILFDTGAAPGQKFKSPAVRAEIGEVAPKTVDPDSIGGDKLVDLAVTTDKIANAAVTSAKIGTGEVKTANLDTGSVTADKIADGAVTGDAIGTGVVAAKDSSGSSIMLTAVRITQTAYDALTVVDPNTLYLVVAG